MIALLVPYEIAAFNLLLQYWTDKIPAAAVIVILALLYAVLHLINIRYFGITEMFMSTFKIAFSKSAPSLVPILFRFLEPDSPLPHGLQVLQNIF